jgi:type I restriction enzyme, S subunit
VSRVQLLAHFDRLCSAPDAIPHLRSFILDLAVRGSLVKQDATDEPASDLLHRIGRAMTSAGAKRHRFPAFEAHDIAFNLPDGWEWVRIRQITADRGQTVPDTAFTYIDVGAIDKEAGRIANPSIVSRDAAPSRARKIVAESDVLYSCVRPYLLNVAVVDRAMSPKPIASTAFAVLNGFGLVLPRYLWTVLRSPFMVDQVKRKMRGQAYPAINDSDFARLPLPLAPLREQARIVAKVHELMALCDQLQAAMTARDHRRDHLATVTLSQLADPPSDDVRSATSATKCIEALLTNTVRRDQVSTLRQAILILATRGCLVQQDPTEEPAMTVIADLAGKNGTSMRRSPPPSRAEAQPRSSVPRGWAMTSIGELFEVYVGATPSRSDQTLWNGDIPWVSSGEVAFGRISATRESITPASLGRSKTRVHPPGTVMLAMIGQGKTRGQPAILDISAAHNQNCASIRVSDTPISSEYIYWALVERYDRTRLLAAGGSQPALNSNRVRSIPIALPPLPEQRRIVDKVEEMMAACDQLDRGLTTLHAWREQALTAMLGEVLAEAGLRYPMPPPA